jgi:hypothetical protein
VNDGRLVMTARPICHPMQDTATLPGGSNRVLNRAAPFSESNRAGSSTFRPAHMSAGVMKGYPSPSAKHSGRDDGGVVPVTTLPSSAMRLSHHRDFVTALAPKESSRHASEVHWLETGPSATLCRIPRSQPRASFCGASSGEFHDDHPSVYDVAELIHDAMPGGRLLPDARHTTGAS